MKWNYVEEKLEKQGLTLFTSQEFRRATGLSPASAKFLLIRNVQAGLALKLKDNRGLYALKRHPPHPWLLANKLLRPSYVSLESALAHYGAIPESVYGVTSVTPGVTRTFQSLGSVYTYHKIKGAAYGGYRSIEVSGATAHIAEPEKALADYLYFVRLGRKVLNDRIRWEVFKKSQVIEYLKLFDRKYLVEWANNVIGSSH